MIMKNFKKVLSFLIVSIPIILPIVVNGAIVPDCGKVENGIINNPCDFDYLMELVNNAITFALYFLATPLAAVFFAYAGFLYLTSGGNEENTKKAKKIIKNVLIGYVIALAAWLIVKTILVSLGFIDRSVFFNISV